VSRLPVRLSNTMAGFRGCVRTRAAPRAARVRSTAAQPATRRAQRAAFAPAKTPNGAAAARVLTPRHASRRAGRHAPPCARARSLQEDPNKGKKNEWVVDSNVPISDPTFAKLLDVVDEQSDVARWMRNNQGARRPPELPACAARRGGAGRAGRRRRRACSRACCACVSET
jgi:hypothetical protein